MKNLWGCLYLFTNKRQEPGKVSYIISLLLGEINSNLLLRVQVHTQFAQAILNALKCLERVYGAGIYDTGVMGDQWTYVEIAEVQVQCTKASQMASGSYER